MQPFINRTVLVSFLRTCAALLVAVALIGPASASAEDEPVTPATTTANGTQTTPTTSTTTSDGSTTADSATAPTTTTTTTTTGGESGKSETDDTLIAALFIAFATISVLILFWYLGSSQEKFFKAVGLVFGQTGTVPEPVLIHTFGVV